MLIDNTYTELAEKQDTQSRKVVLGDPKAACKVYADNYSGTSEGQRKLRVITSLDCVN